MDPNAKLAITFGPAVDMLFQIAICLIILVLGTTLLQWFWNDVVMLIVRQFRDDEVVEDSEPATRPFEVLYEVMWSVDVNFRDSTAVMIERDIEDAITKLVSTHGEGYIRYRPFVEWESDWSTWFYRDQFHRTVTPNELTYDNAALALRTYPLMDPEAPIKYLVEWSATEDFMSTHVHLVDDWKSGSHNLIKHNGSGYIRFRESTDPDAPENWSEPKYLEAELIH